jgi:tRNA threonylcarbamoyladenosine biosynthesis protein TsaE
MTLTSSSPEQTIKIGEHIGSCLKKGDILALQGTLAAGKTTITKGIARGLGITEDVTSPTFTLISEYEGRCPLYHMDVYRLDSTEAFLDLGVEEMLYGSGVCIIEWSEKVMSELPASTIIIKLETVDGNKRKITIDNWTYGDIPS